MAGTEALRRRTGVAAGVESGSTRAVGRDVGAEAEKQKRCIATRTGIEQGNHSIRGTTPGIAIGMQRGRVTELTAENAAERGIWIGGVVGAERGGGECMASCFDQPPPSMYDAVV
jgi:hypothetical protein